MEHIIANYILKLSMLLNSTFSNIKKKIYTVADLYSTPLLTRRKSSELQAMT